MSKFLDNSIMGLYCSILLNKLYRVRLRIISQRLLALLSMQWKMYDLRMKFDPIC